MSDLLTVSETATVAGVSARTMRRWVSSGQVRTVGHGRRVVAASLSELPATNGQNGHEERSPDKTGAATTDTKTDRSAHTANVDTEAGHLADLVRELSERLADQRAVSAVWMERARVLGEPLALTAPQQPPDASGSTEGPNCLPGWPSSPWWRSWAVYGGVGIIALVLLIGLVVLLD